MTPDGATTLADILGDVFPDMPHFRSIRWIGEGFGSRVIETDTGVVFRIGKTTRAAQAYAVQARLLPVLTARIPLLVPCPVWYSPPVEALPFGALGYPKLPGQPLQKHDISCGVQPGPADDLGRFLVALHSFPVDQAAALGVSWWDVRREAEELQVEVMAILKDRLSWDEASRIESWWESFLADPVLSLDRARVIHGDLWFENLLVDEHMTALRAVLDFDEVRIGDVAQDFATLLYLGDEFAMAVLRSYRAHGGDPGPHIQHRIRALWEYREFPILPHLAAIGDTAEIEDTIRKVREGPVLS